MTAIIIMVDTVYIVVLGQHYSNTPGLLPVSAVPFGNSETPKPGLLTGTRGVMHSEVSWFICPAF